MIIQGTVLGQLEVLYIDREKARTAYMRLATMLAELQILIRPRLCFLTSASSPLVLQMKKN